MKYWYVKKEVFEKIINGEYGFRFAHLAYYERLKNLYMKDNETKKSVSTFCGILSINGNHHILRLRETISISLLIKDSHVACFSNKKNDKELFEKFKLNYYVELDIDCLIKHLECFFSALPTFRKGDVEIINQDIVYYNPEDLSKISLSPKNNVFLKPLSYQHEAEHRVTIFCNKNFYNLNLYNPCSCNEEKN